MTEYLQKTSTLVSKITSSQKTNIILEFRRIIKKWKKDTVVKNNLKIFNKKIDYQLKQFWDDNSGLVCVPFEMTFKNTENKIEKTISETYPEFYTWNFLDLNDPKIRDRYYKMKGELERGLTKEDNFAILQSFFDDKLFFPKKKYHPYLICDITSTIVKPFGEQSSPHIILQGRLFFYGKRWLDMWMTESKVTLKKYLGGRTLSFYWKDMPPAFLMHINQTLFRDWIATEVARRFTDKESVEFKLANKILEKRDFSKVKITASWKDRNNLEVNFDGIFQTLFEKIWKNKGKILFTLLLLNKK
jgi:hypothetical protein